MTEKGDLPERGETIREALRRALEAGPRTVRELSTELGLSEREIPSHIDHLARSLRREGRKLAIEPPACRKCGFAFPGRERVTRPGKCPRCRATHIEPPRATIA